jgi:putative phosphonate catabolism associated alcohol dehydrogenase
VADAAAGLPAHGRVAVHDVPGGPFRIASYPLRPPAAGEVLVRVRMSTICRSDIHSYQGHRPSPCPGLLGHEIVGDVVALGEGVRRDMTESPLAVGDRVTWSEYAVPARGYLREVRDLPQKSPGLVKYGHLSSDTPPHHHGGFAEYCYVLPDSWILKLPKALTDAEATPINCGVATMCAVIEAAAVELGHTVIVVGLGLLGLYGAAIAKARGAARVVGIDAVPARRALARRFGVDLAIAPGETPDAGPLGADAVIEVCGDASTISAALAWLRPGGRIVVAGTVNPGSMVTLDANAILRGCVTLVGVHNYHPRHLLQALAFVVGHRERYPLGELVDARYPLTAVDAAMADAASRRVLRAAIVPGPDREEGR